MPSEADLPLGLHRALLQALHDLYMAAGRPGLRAIEEGMQEDDELPATMKRDTISRVLKGDHLPDLLQTKALTQHLARRAGHDPARAWEDVEPLWKAADNDRLSTPEPQPAHRPRPGTVLDALYRLDEAYQPPAPPPVVLSVDGPKDGGWAELDGRLRQDGYALVTGFIAYWQARTEDVERLLGRDFDRYTEQDAPEQYRFLGARHLLKHTAAVALGTEAAELTLAYAPGGRPYLRGVDDLDVNLTVHQGEAAVGISRIGRIGVSLGDAAGFGDEPDTELLEVLSSADLARLRSFPAHQRPALLTDLWLIKNAYTKALGQGRRLRFSQLRVLGGELHESVAGTDREWEFFVHGTTGGNRLAAAVQDADLGPERTLQ
ncbi:4'-phosphopantetheinyl transferase superfamily protein [Streptomyces sp. NRRL B-24572]|uniref:4'-phosphopantetheinyl transferase superfamily protein n=1 Tax=Streptomyces sp. NRRL B-24572 TaxID=1962156 RepID=UPI000A3797CD|nr:4'-phosphopantetheinyl transferase superfamily protein [Streptomyces sp. NRRL B-24572]